MPRSNDKLDNVALANRIDQIRKNEGVSVQTLILNANISKQTYYNIRTSDSSRATISAIARVLGTTYTELTGMNKPYISHTHSEKPAVKALELDKWVESGSKIMYKGRNITVLERSMLKRLLDI